MEESIALNSLSVKIDKFLKHMKVLNPAAISFSFINLLLGLLSISFVDLQTPTIFSGLTSLAIICTIYGRYTSLKKQAEKLGKMVTEFVPSETEFTQYAKFYNLNTIILSMLDVVLGIIAVCATSLVFLSTICEFGIFKVLTVGTNIKDTITAIQSNSRLKAILQLSALLGITYIITRGKNYLKGGKKIMSKIFKFLWANKFTIIDMIIGGVSGYFGAYYIVLSYLTVPIWALYTISSAAAIILAVLAIYLGGETVAAYVKRIAIAALSKEYQEKINTVVDTTIADAAKAEAEAKKLDEAVTKAKAELAAKQEAEAVALAKANLEKEKTNT